jgi:hypothetical protein
MCERKRMQIIFPFPQRGYPQKRTNTVQDIIMPNHSKKYEEILNVRDVALFRRRNR